MMGHGWVFWWVLVGCAIYGLWHFLISARGSDNRWLIRRTWEAAPEPPALPISRAQRIDTSPDGVEWTSRPATMFSGQLFKDGCEWTPRHCDFGNGRLDVLPIEFDDLDDLSRLL